jgi:hypothetical protein
LWITIRLGLFTEGIRNAFLTRLLCHRGQHNQGPLLAEKDVLDRFHVISHPREQSCQSCADVDRRSVTTWTESSPSATDSDQ